MRKIRFLTIVWALTSGALSAVAQQTTTTPLSLAEALAVAQSNNPSVAVAISSIEAARAEQRVIESTWYPTLMVAGEWSHTTSPIGLSANVGEMTGGALADIAPLFANNPFILNILEQVGQTTIALDLVPRNTASVGVDLVWPVFSGGRRIGGSKIARRVVDLAEEQHSQAVAQVTSQLIGAYFGVALAEQVVAVRKWQHESLKTHLRQAQRLYAEGMITHAESLVAEVAVQQALAALQQAQGELALAHRNLCTTLGDEECNWHPTTPLFMPRGLQSEEYFAQAVAVGNNTLRAIDIQHDITSRQIRIEQGGYLPQVALLASQRLWDKGLDDGLFPRTFVGVGVSWTLFDGLGREGRIARSKAARQTTEAAKSQAHSNLLLAVEKLYNGITTAIYESATLETTEQLAAELVRSRTKAFAEGVATSAEVVDAEVMLAEAKLGRLAALYLIDTSLAALLALCGQGDNILDYISLADL